jgi:hypothetical protein
MAPYGFRSTLIAAGATCGFLTLTLYGAIFGLLCVAWLCVRTAPPSRNDEILCAIAEGRSRTKKFPGLTDQ